LHFSRLIHRGALDKKRVERAAGTHPNGILLKALPSDHPCRSIAFPSKTNSGAAAAGAGRSMRALLPLADVAGFWTLDRTTITGRSAVILRQHTTPFLPMIVPFDDLEPVYQSLRN
jgi:hypothetical protein